MENVENVVIVADEADVRRFLVNYVLRIDKRVQTTADDLLETKTAIREIQASLKRMELTVVDAVGRVELSLLHMQQKEEKLMSQFYNDVEALRVAIDNSMNNLAQRVAAIEASVGDAMTPEQVVKVKTWLGQVKNDLDVIAADPANPVPPLTTAKA